MIPTTMTITEFCRLHRISRPTFYAWAQRGEAPVVIAVGAKRLITAEECDNWRKSKSRQVYHGTNTCGP